MRIGIKTLLFGCHQFLIHPYYTWRGWVKMYGKPPKGMWLAFIIHDWGYWPMDKMDGDDDRHPMWAALTVSKRGNTALAKEILLHSRFVAKELKCPPSRLCWADKMGTALMPSLLWAVLARLSGEGWVYVHTDKYSYDTPTVTLPPGVQGHSFKVGDIVQLSSSGKKMSVVAVYPGSLKLDFKYSIAGLIQFHKRYRAWAWREVWPRRVYAVSTTPKSKA